MQRTYGKRALRQPQPQPQPHPSTPKRQRVFVEISRTPETPRTGIVKRMLGRSKTDPGPPTVASPPSPHSLPTAFPEREPTPEAATQPLPTRSIRTYAGSSRSFLVALPAPDADPVQDDTQPHESYADLRARWGIDLAEDDPHPCQDKPLLRRNPSEPSLPAGMMNDLKSITELRSKGESRRFLDEVGYLFEGLDSAAAIGLRRASALEVLTKLCNPDFNRRAKTSDFYLRTWEKFSAARAGTSDKTLDATIAFFAALAARDLRTLTEVAQQKEFIPTLVDILSSFDHGKDVLAAVLASSDDNDLKSHGILRTEITALKSLARLVSKESPSFVNQPSARFFVSHSLATLPPSLLAEQHLPPLLTSLQAELGLLEARISAYESGLSLIPHTDDTPSLWHIEACLRLLDSFLLGHWSSANPLDTRGGLPHVDGLSSELVSLCIASSRLLEDDQGRSGIARQCLCIALRVLTLLSHDDPWWSSAALDVPHALALVAMTAMRSQARWALSSRNAVEAFDLLCLTLGLVMNWATSSPRVAQLVRVESIDPGCSGSRLCVRACRCPAQQSILACLTELHVHYAISGADHRTNDEPPECAFLRGYTAILLGLLVKNDPTNQTVVVSALLGTSRNERIRSLIAHCRAFLDLYNDIPPSSPCDSPRTSPEVEAPTRGANDAGPHARTWDKRGQAIAQSVIASLEILLRDDDQGLSP